ncbi:hypothetical protein M3210_03060 [Oceanobacillus luteolus]|uniref:phage tail spike protein n=1 Tax=Oceanobacillus luteolus TaxID=1274358 RepID=UPI00203C96D3|nr:phage tail spike protein [Oceanobacillus luteolus]MCM3739243.1 hypothetical protein [Oceanobacillus luteolus]
MSKIIITDGQTDEILERIGRKDVIENDHERDLSAYLETFTFTALGNKRYAQYLTDKNRIIIPGEDGEWREFVIRFTDKYRDDETVLIDVIAYGSYQELVGSKIIRSGRTASQSAEAHAREILAGTEVQVGEVAHTGLRTITRENHTDPFSALKSLANEFDLELDFRVEIDGNNITRYADLVKRVGNWNGRYVTFGKDLQSIRRKEETDPVTALLVIGPEREDGTRMEVFVEDEDARNRWGRRGQHIVAVYEPQTENEDITEERLRTLGRTELDKRINAVISFEANIVDLEHVPGMENKKIRFGDTIRTKDETFNPPLFVDARIYKQNRDIFNPSSKRVELGDFTEYTVEQIRENWESIREELEKKIRWLDIKGGIGDIRFTIVSYREPLKAEKSGYDSEFNALYNNSDLNPTVRGNLNAAKLNYDASYNAIISTINTKESAESLSEIDLEEVHNLYQNYEIDLSALKQNMELATDDIAQKKANDAEEGANRYTDNSLVNINEELERAQQEIDRANREIDDAKIEIGDAKDRLETAELDLQTASGKIDNALVQLEDLDRALRDVNNSLADKVNVVDYNQKIGEITNDIASKVDGEWVDGRLRAKADVESVYIKSEIDGMFDNVVSITAYQTDQQGIVERFESAESRIYQNEQAIGGMVKQIDYNADQGRLEERLTEWERTADGFNQSVSRLQTDFDNLEIGGRNLLVNTSEVLKTYTKSSWDWNNQNLTPAQLEQFGIGVGTELTLRVYIDKPTMDARAFIQFTSTAPAYRQNYGNTIKAGQSGWSTLTIKVVQADLNNLSRMNVAVRGVTNASGTAGISHKKLERGNKATDWTPAPEDHQEFTYTQIRQLADEIDLTYAKNNELIAGVRIGDPNPINGANVEITGDTAIYGRISAPNATFLSLTTEDMTAIRATIRDSTVTGNLNANNATFQSGRFNSATIVDATIQNANITGTLNGVGGRFTGQLDGVNGTFTGDMTAGRILSNTSIDVTTDLKVGDNIYLGQSRSTAGKLISFNGIGSTVNTGILSIYSGARMNMRLFTEGYVQMLADELIVDGDLTADVLRTTGGASYGETGLYTYLRPAGNNDHSIRFTNGSGYVAILVDGNVTHAFRTDGTKIGGTIDIDGERLGMSPIDSPQILLSVLLPNVDVKAGKTTEIQLNEKFAKAIANLAVFPSQPVKIKKGSGRFTVTADKDLTVDFMIYGERTGYEGTFWLDTEEEEVA